MLQENLSGQEVSRLGEELYEKKLRGIVETPENIGRMISIDVASGDYAIADDPLKASDMVRERHPEAVMYGMRIGYDAVYAIGGTITRRPPR
jgi:hypothetical protein